MNRLGKRLSWSREATITDREQGKRTAEFLKLYYQLRERNAHSLLGRLSFADRKRLHRLVLALYRLKNRLSGYRCEVLSDLRDKTDRPVIFALTHVGKFDIEVVSEAVKEHYYLLSGDYEHIQGTLGEFILLLNGAFYFNETIKADRRNIVSKMVSHLRHGGNLMYFPEGTWNITPNLPVLPCYWGIIDVARQGNAVIIPVAAEQYGKTFEVNIGHNFDVSRYGLDSSAKSLAIQDLRDILATLKWQIWEQHSASRDEIRPCEWTRYVQRRCSEWPGFSPTYIAGLVYHPKGINSPEEVFAHLDRIEISTHNAFLLRGS